MHIMNIIFTSMSSHKHKINECNTIGYEPIMAKKMLHNRSTKRACSFATEQRLRNVHLIVDTCKHARTLTHISRQWMKNRWPEVAIFLWSLFVCLKRRKAKSDSLSFKVIGSNRFETMKTEHTIYEKEWKTVMMLMKDLVTKKNPARLVVIATVACFQKRNDLERKEESDRNRLLLAVNRPAAVRPSESQSHSFICAQLIHTKSKTVTTAAPAVAFPRVLAQSTRTNDSNRLQLIFFFTTE